MKSLILENLEQPAELERLYRQDPEKFKRTFPLVFKEHPNLTILKVWHERLNFELANDTRTEPDVKWYNSKPDGRFGYESNCICVLGKDYDK
ncbi:MAG: hypothetical protein ACOX42_09955 [Clostridia bacterium]|jgi:hypothetical protein